MDESNRLASAVPKPGDQTLGYHTPHTADREVPTYVRMYPVDAFWMGFYVMLGAMLASLLVGGLILLFWFAKVSL